MTFIAKRLAKKLATTGGVPLLLVLSLTMCSEDVLDKQPLGTLTDETFYKTEKDFDAATLAPYSTMLNLTYEQFGAGLWNGFLKPDDDVQHRDPNEAMDVFNWTPANNNFGWVWANAYKGIARANTVLDQLPRADRFGDPSKKPRYEAEAKFMRAWWYFLLATNWGTPPILTSVPTSIEGTMIGNSAPGEVWDLIESDLTFAVANLPANYGSEKGRATKWTAQALLGKVQVYRAQWFNLPAKYTAAATNLQAVVNSNVFKLTANYGDNFSQTRENNEESLFEVQDTEGDNINSWGTTDTGGRAGHAWTIYVSPSCYYGPVTGCAPKSWGQGYGQIDITPSLFAEFEPGDPRRYYTMYSEGEVYDATTNTLFSAGWSRTGHTPAKYNRPWNTNRFPNNWSENNLRLIRYADVLLLLAEAKLLGANDVAGAAALVNQVRARARTTPVPAEAKIVGTLADVPATGTPTAWHKQYLQHERRVELATEWDYRYEDLVRWHRAQLINIKTDVNFGYPESKANWKETYLLKPIPQSEIDLNQNLKQNPGY